MMGRVLYMRLFFPCSTSRVILFNACVVIGQLRLYSGSLTESHISAELAFEALWVFLQG